MALLPLAGLIAAAIRLTSPGPVIFRQRRCGRNGRPFPMLKFRSMVGDAEQRRDELAALNEMKGPVFKVTHDPRVTPVGGFLRRHALDEMPQLWNVLRGDMSLVGPRPHARAHDALYGDMAGGLAVMATLALFLWRYWRRERVTAP